MKSIYKNHRVAIWDSMAEEWQELVILRLYQEGGVAFYLVRDKEGNIYSKQVQGCDEIRPLKSKIIKIKRSGLKLCK